MAISSVVEEYIYELSKSIGDAHQALHQGVGDKNTPGTALFELQQIQSLIQNGRPYFGIIDVPNGFKVTPTKADASAESPDSDDLLSRKVLVNRGRVAFNNNIINIATQEVPIAYDFATIYDEPGLEITNRYYYGVLLGLPYSEVQKAQQNFITYVVNATSANQSYLDIQPTSILSELTFPITAVINNQVVVFSSFDSVLNRLYVSPSNAAVVDGNVVYGVLGGSFAPQTKITFIYEPKIQTKIGAPYKTTPDVDTFAYFPQLPADWLGIAKVLVADPNHPRLITSNNYQIKNIIDVYPENPNFSTEEQNVLLSGAESIKQAIQEATTYTSTASVIEGLTNYTDRVAEDGQNFVQFWASRPFKARQFYAPGTSFETLSRFEFPSNFADAYYQTYRSHTMQTLGIFRGDMITKTQYNSQAGVPENVSITTVSSPISKLTKGTMIYTVAGVDANHREGLPTIKAVNALSGNDVYIMNEITWDVEANITHHIYKRSNFAGDILDKRLSPEGGYQYSAKPSLPSCVTDGNYTVANNFLLLKITSTGALLGGIKVPFKAVSADALADILIANGGIKAYYWGTSEASTNTPSASRQSELFLHGLFKPTYGETTYATFAFQEAQELDAGTHYIALYFRDELLNKVQIPYQSDGGTTDAYVADASSYDNSSGSNDLNIPLTTEAFSEINGTFDVVLYGFLDYGQAGSFVSSNGTKIMPRILNKPTRLCIHVPPMEVVDTDIGTPQSTSDTTPTSGPLTNDLTVVVHAVNTVTNKTDILTVNIPKDTVRGTKFLLGTKQQVYNKIAHLYVTVGSNYQITSDNRVKWSIYDLITVENAI